MKKLIVIFTCCLLSQFTYAQDIFKDYLYSVDLILKHRTGLLLTEEQETQIKQIHNNSIPDFNNSKWDLDAEVVKLTEMISKSSVDVSASVAQLNEILLLENQIKKMQMQTLLEVKNVLTPEQQELLAELPRDGEGTYSFVSSVNEDPRVVIRVSGKAEKKAEPMFIIDHGDKTEVVNKIPKNINPDNIASITVLKGESAIAIYGSKAKNGVVLIKLKN